MIGTVNTPTVTPTAISGCAGDCEGNGHVSVSDLVAGVAIALGETSLDACAAFDVNRDQRVSVDELVQAVHNALDGCPPAAVTP